MKVCILSPHGEFTVPADAPARPAPRNFAPENSVPGDPASANPALGNSAPAACSPMDFAARELAWYLNEMGVASLEASGKDSKAKNAAKPAAIIKPATTEKTRRDGFTIRLESAGEPITERDAYSIRITPEGGVIRGSNDRSVLLGVYGYLYRLGCRFLAPGRKHELIPSLKNPDQLAIQWEKTAALRHRGVCIEGSNSLENILDFVDWLPKLGYNCFFLQFMLPYAFMARWYRHENNPLLRKEAFTPETAKAYTERIEDEMTKRGLLLHQVGHGWTGEALGLSCNDWNPSPKPLGKEAVCMAAMVNGKRELFHGVPTNTNLCYSNEDAIEAFACRVADYAKNHPAASYIHVWLADAFNNICECAKCQREAPTDQYIRLLNRIDEKLTRLLLPAKIVFLLYQELLWPPVKEALINQKRFVLMFAPISRTFEQSYSLKKDLEPIPPYERNHISLPVSLGENIAFLRAWQEHFKGDGFVYDYPMGRAHYGDLGYVHIARIIAEDIRKLKKIGLDGYISCQELRVCFPNALPNYVMGLMLFDEERTFEEVAKEYFKAAYGTGWERVLDYLTKLSTLCSCDYFNGKGNRENPGLAASMEVLTQLARGFKAFFEGTEEKKEMEEMEEKEARLHGLFWKYLDYHREYSIGLGEALKFLSSGNPEEASRSFDWFRNMICEKERDFKECLDVYRVINVSCNYTGFRLKNHLEETQ